MLAPIPAAFFVCLPGPADSDAVAAAAVSLSLRGKLRDGIWSPFHDGSRDDKDLKVRMFFFEDLAVAFALGALSGIHPLTEFGCKAVAGAMVVVTALHLGYTAFLRPQAKRIEVIFAIINAVALLTFSVVTTAIVVFQWTQALDTLGYMMTGINAALIVQVVILGLFGLKSWRSERSNQNPSPNGTGTTSSGPSSAAGPPAATSAPLLAVPLVAMAAPTPSITAPTSMAPSPRSVSPATSALRNPLASREAAAVPFNRWHENSEGDHL